MYGKIVKYELKVNAKMYGMILGIGLLVAIGAFIGASPLNATHYFINQSGVSLIALVAFTTMIFVLVPVLHFILIGMRYAKSMYGREGYLSFTLPVSSTELVLGKFTASVIWGIAVSVLCGLLAFSNIYSMMVSSFMEFDGASAGEIWGMFWADIERLFSDTALWKVGISFGISILLRIVLFTNYLFLAVTLANLPCFHKGNTILTFVFLYFIPYIEERIISMILGALLLGGGHAFGFLHGMNFAFEIGDFPTIWNGLSYSLWWANILYVLLAVLHIVLVIWLAKRYTALTA